MRAMDEIEERRRTIGTRSSGRRADERRMRVKGDEVCLQSVCRFLFVGEAALRHEGQFPSVDVFHCLTIHQFFSSPDEVKSALTYVLSLSLTWLIFHLPKPSSRTICTSCSFASALHYQPLAFLQSPSRWSIAASNGVEPPKARQSHSRCR